MKAVSSKGKKKVKIKLLGMKELKLVADKWFHEDSLLLTAVLLTRTAQEITWILFNTFSRTKSKSSRDGGEK